MKTRIGFALLIVLLASFNVGCLRGPLSWQRITLNQPITKEDVSFIVDGSTRLTDVVDRLGAPDEIDPASGSIVARYHFANGKYFRADYGWALRFVVPFLAPDLVLGGGGFGADIFQVICDQHWVIQEHAFAWHANSSEFRFWPFGDGSR